LFLSCFCFVFGFVCSCFFVLILFWLSFSVFIPYQSQSSIFNRSSVILLLPLFPK
jgi:hypothetical protein